MSTDDLTQRARARAQSLAQGSPDNPEGWHTTSALVSELADTVEQLQASLAEAVSARNYAMRQRDEEARAKVGNIEALNAAIVERDAARTEAERLRDEVESKARDGRLRLRAMTTDRDALRVENERLSAIEFIHNGCETIRRKDVQAVLDQCAEAQAALERVQGVAAVIADECAHHEAEEGDPAQVRTRTGWSDVSGYAQAITRALEGVS